MKKYLGIGLFSLGFFTTVGFANTGIVSANTAPIVKQSEKQEISLNQWQEGDHSVSGKAAPYQRVRVRFKQGNTDPRAVSYSDITANEDGHWQISVPEFPSNGWMQLDTQVVATSADSATDSGGVFIEYVDNDGRELMSRQTLISPMSVPLWIRYEAQPPSRIKDYQGKEYWFVRRDKAFSAFSERVTKYDKTVRFIYEPVN